MAFEDKKTADGRTNTCPRGMWVPTMLLIPMAPWMVLLTMLLFYRAATGTHQLEDDGSSDEEEELFVNTNHPSPPDYSPSDTSSSSGQDWSMWLVHCACVHFIQWKLLCLSARGCAIGGRPRLCTAANFSTGAVTYFATSTYFLCWPAYTTYVRYRNV